SRLRASVPQRLARDAELAVVMDVGDDAEQGWESGDWINARTLYARASERLQDFLDRETTPQEKAQLRQSNVEAVARLETEKTDLLKQIDALRKDKSHLSEQLAATNSQRLQAEQEAAALTRERDELK